MAGRFLGMFKVFRGRKKKDHETASEQQPGEQEEFRPPQEGAAVDGTQERKPKRGRFRRALKMFRRFVPIPRRRSSTTAAEGTAQPDSTVTELQAEADASPEPLVGSEYSDRKNEIGVKASLPSTSEDIASTTTSDGGTQGMAKAEISPRLTEHSDTAANGHRAKADTALTEGMDIPNTDTGETQGRADNTPSPAAVRAPGMDSLEESAVPPEQQVPAREKNIHQRLASSASTDAKPQAGTLRQAEEHPDESWVNMLCLSPVYDRAVAVMWKAIAVYGPEIQKLLPALLEAMENWPMYRMCISDEDNGDTSALPTPKPSCDKKTSADQETKPDSPEAKPTDVSTALPERAGMTNYVVKADQVPAMVRIIHERLASLKAADIRLFMNILRMADEQPAGVVLTLLRCASTCDRAAIMMWRAIGSSSSTAEKVLPTLLCVMEHWPTYSTCTSDGDDTNVFALAATLALWVIVQVPKCQEAMHDYSSQLLVALLVQIFDSTVHGTEEVDTFWRQCKEEHHLDKEPSRFAVQTVKALLCRLRCENVVVEMGRKQGWDTLLCADTQHYAVGLLARAMRRVSSPLCSHLARHLFGLLSAGRHRWDLPFLAFLVEVLECLDSSERSGGVLEMMAKYLQEECRQRRRLALRGLRVLIKDPSTARRTGILSQHLVDVLGDADGEVVGMALSVFTDVLQHENIMISSTTALKLAEALLPLFDSDNRHVQLISIQLFQKVMDLVVDEGKKHLKRIVSQSLLPLFLHCHEENQAVAKASLETLLHATEFLKKRTLKWVAKKEKLPTFGKCLLADDKSRAAEHLRRALPYLESPQESLREAAIRFIGTAGQRLKGQPGELEALGAALQAMRKDESPSPTNLEIQAIFGQRSADLRSSAGFREPVSQEEYQETGNKPPPLSGGRHS